MQLVKNLRKALLFLAGAGLVFLVLFAILGFVLADQYSRWVASSIISVGEGGYFFRLQADRFIIIAVIFLLYLLLFRLRDSLVIKSVTTVPILVLLIYMTFLIWYDINPIAYLGEGYVNLISLFDKSGIYFFISSMILFVMNTVFLWFSKGQKKFS